MKEKKGLLVLLVVFAAVLVGAGALYAVFSKQAAVDPLGGSSSQNQSDASEERMEAPDFTVVDGEGNEISLSDFRGKPVILNFWASWCGPCQSEMPDFDSYYNEYQEDIHFLMVNVTGGRETVDTAKEFIQEEGYTFPVYYDTKGEGSTAYGVYGIPMTFFIDEEGYVAAYAQTAISGETIQKGIDMIFEQE